MRRPNSFLEIFLHSGEYFFGDQDCRVRTVLGSCVSVTFWHPTKLLGGMCHILLPTRSQNSGYLKVTRDSNLDDYDAKYADEAFMLILDEIYKNKTSPDEYQVKLFGGGDMFSKDKESIMGHIGYKNIEATQQLLKHYGFKCKAKNIGGLGHRYIVFDIWSGYVWMRSRD